jgi:GNAT superfamily N-acetyltransferase
VATVPFADGTTVDCVGPELELLELLELLLLLLLEPADGRQGGTISVTTLLLAGRTSSFCGVAPAAEALALPPGVTKTVLAGGGATAWLELELLLLLLELEDDPHGSIATVCVTALRGITITLEPGGTVVVAVSPVTAASEQGGIAIVSGVCCLGITTDLTPGFWRAAATGSVLELELLPHAASSAPIAAAIVKDATPCLALELAPLMIPPGAAAGRSAICARHAPADASLPEGSYPAVGSPKRNPAAGRAGRPPALVSSWGLARNTARASAATVRAMIATVTEPDLPDLLPLMRAYCDFYDVNPGDNNLLAMSRALIADPHREGVQLIARDEANTAIGFATIFWSWSTLSASRIGVMNDLFVAPGARGGGIGRALIDACRERCRQRGASALAWQTARDNAPARALYEQIGARRSEWLDYSLKA